MFWSLAAFVVLLFLLYNYYRRAADAPPGPIGIPVLGVSRRYKRAAFRSCQEWSKQHGPIISVRILFHDWVVLNDYDSIREAFVTMKDFCSGRPQSYFLDILTQGGRGIGFVDNGEFHRKQKLHAHRALNRDDFNEDIKQAADLMLAEIAKHESSPVDLSSVLSRAAVKCMCRIVLGKRMDDEDPNFEKLHEYFSKTIADKDMSSLIGISTILPSLFRFPYFRRKAFVQSRRKSVVMDVFREVVAEFRRSGEKNSGRGFVAAMLEELEPFGDPTFVELQVTQCCYDCFFASVEPIFHLLRWSLVVLIHHQDAQARLRDEIQRTSVKGAESDSEKVADQPYTDAFIHELMRFRTVVPMGLPHKVTEDVSLRGYRIRKGTIVVGNIWAVHNDPSTWNEPERFEPERHLDEHGKFVESRRIIPASIGPRYCLGREVFGRIVRICLIAMAGSFQFDEDPLHGPPELYEGTQGAAFHPFPFTCIARASRK